MQTSALILSLLPMVKRVFFSLLHIFLLLTVSGFGQSSFFKAYGKLPQDYCYSFDKTFDGGYILSGYTNGFGGTNYSLLIKTDANGDTNWIRAYAPSNNNFGYSICQGADSGYVLCGITGFSKVSADGTPLWNYIYSGVIFYSIKATSDKGFILAGSIGSTSSSNGIDVFLLKTDSNGIKQWSRKIGGPNDDYATCVRVLSGGGYIFAGSTNSYGAGGFDMYVVKTNSLGDTLWTRTYGGSNNDGGTSSTRQTIERTFDGGYIVGGYSNSFATSGSFDAYLVKIDSVGDHEWSKMYGGTAGDQIYDVKQCTDSGYVFTGITNSFGAGLGDIYLVKTNALGDTLFTRTFGGALNDYGYGVKETADKGFILCGYTANFGSGNNDAVLIKTDSLGNSSCHQYNTQSVVSSPATQVGITTTGKIFITINVSSVIPTLKTGGNVVDACVGNSIDDAFVGKFAVYPNPNSGVFTISAPSTGSLKITICDLLGKTVYQKTVEHPALSIPIALPELASGTYLLKLQGEGINSVLKLLVNP